MIQFRINTIVFGRQGDDPLIHPNNAINTILLIELSRRVIPSVSLCSNGALHKLRKYFIKAVNI